MYNTEDGRRALRDIFALQLFDNVQIIPRTNMKDESKIDIDIMLKERPMKTAEVECEWALRGGNGRPALASVVPGEFSCSH
jgi:outer membrane protein assembly factor BamA